MRTSGINDGSRIQGNYFVVDDSTLLVKVGSASGTYGDSPIYDVTQVSYLVTGQSGVTQLVQGGSELSWNKSAAPSESVAFTLAPKLNNANAGVHGIEGTLGANALVGAASLNKVLVTGSLHVAPRTLSRRARLAESDRELGFSLVNDSMALAPFRQAALWLADGGTWCLSGVVQVDANVPYVQWLDRVARHWHGAPAQSVRTFTARDLPPELAAEWTDWWPAHALCLGSTSKGVQGAAIFVREEPWQPEELAEFQTWSEVWWHAFAVLHTPRMAPLKRWRRRVASGLGWGAGQPGGRYRRWLVLLAVVLCPVRLTVLAPGELVPAKPLVVRAPLDGVIDVFHVQPNQQVQAEQPLFSFDEIVIQSRLDVALQALATAETDYRQTSQMALMEAKSKVQLGLLVGKIEERQAEIQFLQEQLLRSRVLAPVAGVVLMDDPAEWIGKPVSTGERILRIATLDDMEVEAWLPLADAIGLSAGDQVSLYLSANPLSPIQATLRYMAFEAVQRPDGVYAYRVRASLTGTTSHRVGLKGTAKLHAGWVPLGYWVLRRPWATMRAYVGL